MWYLSLVLAEVQSYPVVPAYTAEDRFALPFASTPAAIANVKWETDLLPVFFFSIVVVSLSFDYRTLSLLRTRTDVGTEVRATFVGHVFVAYSCWVICERYSGMYRRCTRPTCRQVSTPGKICSNSQSTQQPISESGPGRA